MTRFGVNYWPWAGDQDVHAQSIRNLGCKEVRVVFDWRTLEPAQGQFNWAHFDPVVHELWEHGLGVLPILEHTPAWHRPNRWDAPDPAVYALAALTLLRRYGFTQLEVWNEPNWRNTAEEPLDWNGTWEQYAALYRETRRSVHGAGLQTSVVLGGLAMATGWPANPHSTTEAFLGFIWPLCGPIDAIGFHPYGSDADDSIAKIRRLVQFVNGKGSKAPIDVTEIGAPVPPWSEKARATYLKRMAAWIKGWPRIRRCDVYSWNFHTEFTIAQPTGAWKGSASAYSDGIKS